MREIRNILETLDNLPDGDAPVLATVVSLEGSSFRLPGAKMLILDDGTTVGTVSGGCLEADVLERAAEVRETGQPAVHVYDTTADEDSVFSLNMGCRGVIKILLEPAVGNQALKFYRENIENSRAGVIARCFDGHESGKHLVLDTAGLRFSDFSEASVTQKVLAEADRVLNERSSGIVVLKFGSVFVEFVPVPTKLLIYGAGADAVALCRQAAEIGWRIHVVDHRPKYANLDRFRMADVVAHPPRERLVDAKAITKNSVAVVKNHNLELDSLVLKELLATKAAYIGVMGPKVRTEQMLTDIAASGVKIPENSLKRLYGPVGLDIGATTPEGIALSILAEIQAVLSGRTGGFLKRRKGSIYGE